MQAFRDAAAAGHSRTTVTHVHGRTDEQGQRVERKTVLHDSAKADELCLPVPYYNRGARIDFCACTPQNAVPKTLPWLEAPTFNKDAVNGVGIAFRKHTPAAMQKMAPYFDEMCQKHGITAYECANTMAALHTYLEDPARACRIDSDTRKKALSVALEMHGRCAIKPAYTFVYEGRELEWTRLIEFAGEASLAVLTTVSVTGTAACATYLAAQYAAGQMAVYKGTFCLVTKLGSPLLAAGAGVAAAGFGVATAGCVVGSVRYYVAVINAFRDVWDKEAARDAYLLHRLREHNGMTKDCTTACRHHSTGQWTGPGSTIAHGWRGGRSN